jgi:N-ethylmaleimide reductase
LNVDTIVPNLLKPLQMGNLTLKNRVVMAPMTHARAGVERIPNDAMVEYYRQRSHAGLIITEGTHTSPEAIGWINTPAFGLKSKSPDGKRLSAPPRDCTTPVGLRVHQ